MKQKQFLAVGTAMALSFCVSSVLHANDVSREGKGENVDRKQTEPANEGVVRETNKASKLVGMDVKNPANEDIGTVNDIVLDLSSGRVAYVVLSVGGFLGVGEKYIAVPPSAFRASTDGGNNLVLNVDKQRVQQAPGFSKSEWPDLNNPNWGAAADWGSTNTVRTDPNALPTGKGRPTDPAPEREGSAPEVDRGNGESDQRQHKSE